MVEIDGEMKDGETFETIKGARDFVKSEAEDNGQTDFEVAIYSLQLVETGHVSVAVNWVPAKVK
jgi:antirestriction protein ArdC